MAELFLTRQRIVPNIWCTRNAEEAAAFYTDIFENSAYEIESRYPHEGLLDFQQELAGMPLTVALTISGYRFVLINAADETTLNPSVSFILNFDPLLFEGDETLARSSLDRIWSQLIDGGFALMPLGEYPFSAKYGWVQDRYGVSWQLMLTDPAGDPRPFIMPALLFSERVQNHAGEAIGQYLDVFSESPGGSELGLYVLYPEKQGPAEPGTIQFSDFQLDQQWFVAMDSGVEQPFTFTSGISFEVQCDDQAEIDRLWQRLSFDPEAEQCGWLTDRFGVRWQIVPSTMGELMALPGAFEKLLAMKKIVIADF